MREKIIKYPKLIDEMAARGETQTTIGKVLGVTQATISRKLSGKANFTIGEVELICEYLKKDYYQLFK